MPTIGEPFAPFGIKYPSGACMAPLGLLTDPSVSTQAKIVYIRLTRYAGKDGVCRPSEDTLATELGLSSRRLRDKLRRLEAAEYIRCRRRGWGKFQEYDLLWHPRFEKIKISQFGHPDGSDRTVPSGQEPTDRTVPSDQQTELFPERTVSSDQQFQRPSERTLSSDQEEGPERTLSSALTGQFRPLSEKGVLKGLQRAHTRAGGQAYNKSQPASQPATCEESLISKLGSRIQTIETQLVAINQVHERLTEVLERLVPPSCPDVPPAAPLVTAIQVRPEIAAYLNTFTRTMGEAPPAAAVQKVCANLDGATLEQFQTQVERRINGGLKPQSWAMFVRWAHDVGVAREVWEAAPERKPVMSESERRAQLHQECIETIDRRNRERAVGAGGTGAGGK